MYPTKIKHPSAKDLFSLWFTDGDATLKIINDETFSLTTSDGQPLFNAKHSIVESMQTFTNIIPSGHALSTYSFDLGCRLLWKMFSMPDTIITGQQDYMIQKVRELQRYYEIRMGWKIEHVVCPQLKDDKKYRWFLADSRKATGHYKKLGMGISELCVFSYDWIVASFSTICPCLE